MEARVKKKKCENAGLFSSRKTSKIQFFPGNQQYMNKKLHCILQLLQWPTIRIAPSYSLIEIMFVPKNVFLLFAFFLDLT